MNYIDHLTKEEKAAICGIIGGKTFKKFFVENERDFQKIKKGYRAKALQEQLALKTAIANIDTPFVSFFVNRGIDSWLKEIQANIEKLEAEGKASETALAASLIDSVFINDIGLYLKLAEKTLDQDTISRLYDAMINLIAERAKNAEMAEFTKNAEAEKRQLSEQLEAAKQTATAEKEKYEQKLHEIEQRNISLESQLSDAKNEILELQVATSDNPDDSDYLTQFDDTDLSLLPTDDSGEIVSLCGVLPNYSDQRMLARYADLGCDGQYHIFRRDDDLDPYFTNRDRIFHRDGPSNDGFCGIWTWYTTQSEKDFSKDYVSSRFNNRLDAIEIIEIPDASSLESLIDIIKDGTNCRIHSRRIMFAFYASKWQYTGILCGYKDLNTDNGMTTFAEDCVEVPVYEFMDDDILRLDNGLNFYKNAFAGCPKRLCKVKAPLDIVKNIVLSSISWSAYKTRGATRAEYKNFRELLGVLPVDDINAHIKSACRCSDSDAEKLLSEFLNVAYKYIDDNIFEDQIIYSAISASTELQERAKSLIRADWEKENQALLDEANKKFDSIEAKLKSATASLEEAQEAFSRTKSEEEHLKDIIAEKEKLAEDVEAAVAERIDKARENAADFIANMAFAGRQQVQVAVENTPAVNAIPSASVDPNYHVFGEAEDRTELEANHSWKDAVYSAAIELGEAGVSEKYRSGLAACLCAAYIEKQPILLVGPNAIDIAEAFCAATVAHKHGILSCEGRFSSQIIEEIGLSGENIVIVNNLISSGFMNRLPEILSKKDIFYIATHPYAEDVQVEPKSLYNFMLPLFTEFFVDRKATGNYYGGYFADDFKDCLEPKITRRATKLLSGLSLNNFVRNRIDRVAAIMRMIDSEISVDEEFLFAVLPIAYATLEMDELKELIADSQNGIAISESLKRDLRFVLGEI